jgi:DNA-binding response OmpR family regulator
MMLQTEENALMELVKADRTRINPAEGNDFPNLNGLSVAFAVGGRDGLTMAEKVRTELGNNTVNIIMLTTENSPAIKERGKAAGIKGWIVKPFKGEAVIATFKKLVA